MAINKTIFFVDNLDYINIMKEKLEYSTIPECIKYTSKDTFNYIIDGKSYSYMYTNNKIGFLNVLAVYFDDKEVSEKIKKEEMLKKEKEIKEKQCDYSRYMPH